MLAQHVALAVSQGGHLLGEAAVRDPGPVLYLNLDGTDAGFQDRMDNMLRAESESGELPPAPENLWTFHETWPRLDDGGLDLLAAWMNEQPDTRLVIVDMYKQVRPVGSGYRNAYSKDSGDLQPLTDLAHERDVSVLLVHHTNKRSTGSVTDLMNGSNGLTGAVENLMLMQPEKSKDGTKCGTLTVVPRYARECEHRLVLDGRFQLWKIDGDDEQDDPFPNLSGKRKAIVEYLDAKGPRTLDQIADEVSGKRKTLRKTLGRMFDDGQAERVDADDPSSPWRLLL
jgi:hypothetical protein